MTPVRILVVEDRGIVADKIERVLRGAGHDVLGLAPTLMKTLALIEQFADTLDLAILDIDLRGEPVYPLANALAKVGIPFLFVTGYGARAIDEHWRDVVRIEKPFENEALLRGVWDALASECPSPASTSPARTASPAVRNSWDAIRETRDILTDARAYRELKGLSKP